MAHQGRFARDERGAVMVMGLAMILSLVAFMWFCLGIGETVVFRDHMQDSADAAAFSHAAVDAAGMNILVLINYLILLVVIIYLVLSIILTVKFFKMVAELASCPEGLIECAKGVVHAFEYVFDWYPDRGNKAEKLSKVDKGLSLFQSGIAIAAPVGGLVASIDAGRSYSMHSMNGTPVGLGFSKMNIPDMAAMTSVGKSMTAEYGLPVTHEPLGNDCAHLLDMTAGFVEGLMGLNGKLSFVSKLMNSVSGMAGAAFQWYYCGTDTDPPPIPVAAPVIKHLPGAVKKIIEKVLHEGMGGGDAAPYWGQEGYGPMVIYKHKKIDPTNLFDYVPAHKDRHKPEQKNGADHQQVYSVAFSYDSYNDNHASHNIGLMQLQHQQGFQTPEQKAKGFFVPILFYYGEAELFADCDPAPEHWDHENCDNVGPGNDRMDWFMYKFGWRARLVAVHAPAGGIKKFFDSIGTGLGYVSNVKSYINGGDNNSFIKYLHMFDSLFDTTIGQELIDDIGNIADYIPDNNYH